MKQKANGYVKGNAKEGMEMDHSKMEGMKRTHARRSCNG
jgi:hypothetical protein